MNLRKEEAAKLLPELTEEEKKRAAKKAKREENKRKRLADAKALESKVRMHMYVECVCVECMRVSALLCLQWSCSGLFVFVGVSALLIGYEISKTLT